MENRLKNWVVVLIAVFVTFSVLGASQMLWQKFAVARPLDAALQGIDGVTKVVRESGSRKDDIVKVQVSLKNAANLQKTYTELADGITAVIGSRRIQIILSDSRNAELESFYYSVQPNLQEAMATGKFTVMVKQLEEQAAPRGIKAQVFIDNRNIYLQLVKDEAELYQVVPRLTAVQEVK